MELNEIGKKKFLGKGEMAKCYLLEDGNVLKLFNCQRSIDEMEMFKHFMKYDNDSFVFPFEFIYDSEKFYGYITKFALGKTLEVEFPKSNLLNLSTNSIRLEKDIDFVSQGGIVLYDLHDRNVLYDGKKYSVIDHDENGIKEDVSTVRRTNRQMHRILIGNLFIENLRKLERTKLITDKIQIYKFMDMKPSEMIVQIKSDMDNYYKEDINTVEEVKDIIRR